MAMTADTSIACIGAGYWGKNQVRNFNALEMLSCVCETSEERQAELAAAYPDAHLTDSFEEVLANPQVDGVAIATPAETHGKLVRQALWAGKDVFVEKPLSLSIAEEQKLIVVGEIARWRSSTTSRRRRSSCSIPTPSAGRTTCPFPTGPRPSRSPSGSVSGIKLLGYALD